MKHGIPTDFSWDWFGLSDPEILSTQMMVLYKVIQDLGNQSNEITAIRHHLINAKQPVVWDETGELVYNAMVWQDKRVAPLMRTGAQTKGNFPSYVRQNGRRCISRDKINWILENVAGAQARAEKKANLRLQHRYTWLIWNLTKAKITVTDLFQCITLSSIIFMKTKSGMRVVGSRHTYSVPAWSTITPVCLAIGIIKCWYSDCRPAGDQQAAALFESSLFFIRHGRRNTYGTGFALCWWTWVKNETQQ